MAAVGFIKLHLDNIVEPWFKVLLKIICHPRNAFNTIKEIMPSYKAG
jgi:hypothetical protein